MVAEIARPAIDRPTSDLDQYLSQGIHTFWAVDNNYSERLSQVGPHPPPPPTTTTTTTTDLPTNHQSATIQTTHPPITHTRASGTLFVPTTVPALYYKSGMCYIKKHLTPWPPGISVAKEFSWYIDTASSDWGLWIHWSPGLSTRY